MTEMKRSLMIVLKLDKKMINIRLSINGDFLVQVIIMIRMSLFYDEKNYSTIM